MQGPQTWSCYCIPQHKTIKGHEWLVCFSFLHLWFYFGVIMIKHVLMYLLRFALWHISSNCSSRFFRMGAHFSVDNPTPRAPNHGSSCARQLLRNGETKGWMYHGDGEVDGRQRETRCAMCCARFCPVSRRRRHPFDWMKGMFIMKDTIQHLRIFIRPSG